MKMQRESAEWLPLQSRLKMQASPTLYLPQPALPADLRRDRGASLPPGCQVVATGQRSELLVLTSTLIRRSQSPGQTPFA